MWSLTSHLLCELPDSGAVAAQKHEHRMDLLLILKTA